MARSRVTLVVRRTGAMEHGFFGCKMVLIWRRTTLGPVLMWGGPSQDPYDALDRLLGYLVSEPEWLPP